LTPKDLLKFPDWSLAIILVFQIGLMDNWDLFDELLSSFFSYELDFGKTISFLGFWKKMTSLVHKHIGLGVRLLVKCIK